VIHGRFVARGNHARPAAYLDASLESPSSSGLIAIEFMIDTGADFTTVHPSDAVRLWPDYLSWDFANDPTAVEMTGVGGVVRYVRRQVRIELQDDTPGVVSSERLGLWVPPPQHAGLWGFPSLLGRDVLGQFKVTIHEASGSVILELG